MKRFTVPFFICLLCFLGDIGAQDPYFSQFYANRVYLNPAYAGFDPGTTVLLNYRNQWPGVPDGDVGASPTSYRTLNATADFRLPCFQGPRNFSVGLAGSVFHDDAGRAPLVTQGAGVAFSAAKRLIRGGYKRQIKYFDIRLGAQLSAMQRRINGDFFIYSSQLDPYIGLINEPEVLNLRSRIYPNLNVGLMFNFGNDRFAFSAGGSSSNVLEPDQALYDAPSKDRLLRRYTGHLGLTADLTNNFSLSPHLRADFQSGADLGLFSGGMYLQSDQMYGGLFYQWNRNLLLQTVPGNAQVTNVNHLIFQFGVDLQSIIDIGNRDRLKNRFILGVTYDFTMGGLNQRNTQGGLEFAVRMFFDGGLSRNCLEDRRNQHKRCPILSH
jgi:type IX secretion system PorP/SprF family membrane protein